jgi:hypothetical protein
VRKRSFREWLKQTLQHSIKSARRVPSPKRWERGSADWLSWYYQVSALPDESG